MRATTLDGFIRQTIADNNAVAVPPSAVFAGRIQRFIKCDYRAALHRLFVRSEVQDLVATGERIAWPRLNRKQLRGGPPQRYAAWSAERNVTTILGRQEDSETLLGFYMPKALGLETPLIWLNSAVKHRAILSATFVHEMGHHVAGQVLGENATIHSAVGERLDNRHEIAADLFVSIAAMPRATAEAMFRQHGDSIEYLRRTYRRMCKRYGVSLDRGKAVEEDLTCLFGSLHYLKLREALLTEFRL
jgi:uncharacterized protein DUF955